MSQLTSRIAENLAEVRQRIAEAAGRSGRDPEEITLVAVTKYVGEAEVRALLEAGCTLLGENRPQELWQKAQAVADLPARWHMIGHLQRNKVRRSLPLVEMIQSVDSPRLLAAVDRVAGELSLRMPVLLEVNVSGEQAKHGFDPESVEAFVAQLAGLGHVQVRGLMCMAGLYSGRDGTREEFASLRRLRDRLRENCPEAVTPGELSMGMSGDYEVAIEEGATMVRVGSALFRGVL